MRISIKMYFDHESDRDVLSYMDSMSAVSRNRLVRDLLRQHMAGGIETISDTLIRIERKLDSLSTRAIYPNAEITVRQDHTEVTVGDSILKEPEANLTSLGG